MKSNLPPVSEIASLMPEELAALVLQDLANLGQMERGHLNIRAYCGHFDSDIHGPVRTLNERVRTGHALEEAWSRLEHLGLIAPDTDQSYGGGVFVTRRGHEAVRSADAYRQSQQRAHFPQTISFWYTNEYYPADGSFACSTWLASLKVPG